MSHILGGHLDGSLRGLGIGDESRHGSGQLAFVHGG